MINEKPFHCSAALLIAVLLLWQDCFESFVNCLGCFFKQRGRIHTLFKKPKNKKDYIDKPDQTCLTILWDFLFLLCWFLCRHLGTRWLLQNQPQDRRHSHAWPQASHHATDGLQKSCSAPVGREWRGNLPADSTGQIRILRSSQTKTPLIELWLSYL